MHLRDGFATVASHSANRFYICSAILLLSGCMCPLFGANQQAPERDSSAIAFLTQAVSVAASGTDLTSIQDFVALGTSTHFWGTNPEQGQITVKSKGLMQFRIDSNVTEGTWSWIVNNGNGEIVVPSGAATPIAYHNCLNPGSLIWPILKVNAALQDQTMTVIDMGVVQFNNGQARQIRLRQNFQSDPTGLFSSLTNRDYFFDPATFALLRAQDSTHPNNDAKNGAMTHTIDLANYQSVNGLLVPFSITESISGQKTWNLQLNSISFNTGLTDSDFQF